MAAVPNRHTPTSLIQSGHYTLTVVVLVHVLAMLDLI